MAKTPKKDEIEDEPGAEDRFSRIMRRALTTPPKRKTTGSEGSDPAASSKKKGQK